MANGNPRLLDEIEGILSATREEIPIEEIYKAVKRHCETNKPREEFNRAIAEAVNLGIAQHRNTLEYKGAIMTEDGDEAGPSDCYGRNRRGGRRKRSSARSRSKSRSPARKKRSSPSKRSRSPRKAA
uniref:Uncharacterized protein n=1 Tax=Glossina austeni TaxID=7395 RepID=A0A1A9V3L5_GLOAU